MEEQKSINQGQSGVADKEATENKVQERYTGVNNRDKQKQAMIRIAKLKLADVQDQAGVDLALRVQRDERGSSRDKIKFLYEHDSHSGAFEIKFEVKHVNEEVGKGVFTTQHVKKGARVWNDKNSLEATYTTEELKKLFNESPELAEPILDYGYMWNGMFNLPLDASKYCNHSKTPSANVVKSKQELADLRGVQVEEIPPDEYSLLDAYATRDLVPGEEITMDYREYDETPGYLELCQMYDSIPSIECGKMF